MQIFSKIEWLSIVKKERMKNNVAFGNGKVPEMQLHCRENRQVLFTSSFNYVFVLCWLWKSYWQLPNRRYQVPTQAIRNQNMKHRWKNHMIISHKHWTPTRIYAITNSVQNLCEPNGQKTEKEKGHTNYKMQRNKHKEQFSNRMQLARNMTRNFNSKTKQWDSTERTRQKQNNNRTNLPLPRK